MGSHWDEDWSLLAKSVLSIGRPFLPQSCFDISAQQRARTSFAQSCSTSTPAATGLQEPQAACPCWEPVAGATDLSVQVDICNTVQGKLVSVGPVLVDVGDGQTGQLPHRFVIAGYGREFDGRQGKTVGARQISARQKKAGKQQKGAAGRVAHGCTHRQ